MDFKPKTRICIRCPEGQGEKSEIHFCTTKAGNISDVCFDCHRKYRLRKAREHYISLGLRRWPHPELKTRWNDGNIERVAEMVAKSDHIG